MASAVSTPPSSYSSRELGYMTPIRYQGSTSSCWAFAAIACLETAAIKKGWETPQSIDLSEAHLAWSVNSHPSDASDYFICEDSQVYNTGGSVEKMTYPVLSGYGLADEKDYPFGTTFNSTTGDLTYVDENGQTVRAGYYTDEQIRSNNGYTIGSYQFLDTENEVKNWIMEYGSVCVSSYVLRFGSLKNKTYTSVPLSRKYDYTIYNSSETTTNHALTVIGWDDSFPKEFFQTAFVSAPPHDGAWLCKNSMNAETSTCTGYVWVPYEDTSLRNFIGLTIEKATDNVHTYNATRFTSEFTVNTDKSMSFANI